MLAIGLQQKMFLVRSCVELANEKVMARYYLHWKSIHSFITDPSKDFNACDDFSKQKKKKKKNDNNNEAP